MCFFKHAPCFVDIAFCLGVEIALLDLDLFELAAAEQGFGVDDGGIGMVGAAAFLPAGAGAVVVAVGVDVVFDVV